MVKELELSKVDRVIDHLGSDFTVVYGITDIDPNPKKGFKKHETLLFVAPTGPKKDREALGLRLKQEGFQRQGYWKHVGFEMADPEKDKPVSKITVELFPNSIALVNEWNEFERDRIYRERFKEPVAKC